jgi:hypothetical protein
MVTWFHKNVYLSDKIWIVLKPLPFLSCRFLVVSISPTRMGELNSHHQQSPCRWKAYVYDAVLPGAPKGSFATLLSPPHCHAALSMMPHTLTLVDQSPVCHLEHCPFLWRARLGLNFGGVVHHILHGLTRVQTQASAVWGRRLTTWAMAQPLVPFKKSLFPSKM